MNMIKQIALSLIAVFFGATSYAAFVSPIYIAKAQLNLAACNTVPGGTITFSAAGGTPVSSTYTYSVFNYNETTNTVGTLVTSNTTGIFTLPFISPTAAYAYSVTDNNGHTLAASGATSFVLVNAPVEITLSFTPGCAGSATVSSSTTTGLNAETLVTLSLTSNLLQPLERHFVPNAPFSVTFATKLVPGTAYTLGGNDFCSDIGNVFPFGFTFTLPTGAPLANFITGKYCGGCAE